MSYKLLSLYALKIETDVEYLQTLNIKSNIKVTLIETDYKVQSIK